MSMDIKQIYVTYLLVTLFIGGCLTLNGCQQNKVYHKTDRGIIVSIHKRDNQTENLRLEVMNEHIIRVTASPNDDFSRSKSLMLTHNDLPSVAWKVHRYHDSLMLQTKAMKAMVSLKTGQVQFMDTSGHILLAEKKDGRT